MGFGCVLSAELRMCADVGLSAELRMCVMWLECWASEVCWFGFEGGLWGLPGFWRECGVCVIIWFCRF